MSDQSRRVQLGNDGFEAARGAVRDGLAAQQNLEHLLRSPRIGPRALAKVVDQLRPGCAPLTEALELLLQKLAARVTDAAVTTSLRTFMVGRTQRLEQALQSAAESDMGAKARLRLEAEVGRVRPELAAVGELVDLLDAAATCSPTELDVNALTAEAVAKLAPARRDAQSLVRVVVMPAPERPTLLADPRVVMPLIAIMLGFLALDGATTAQLLVAVDPVAGARLNLRAGANNCAAYTPCAPPRIIAPTLGVAGYAAACLGATLECDRADAVLVLPPGQVLHTADRTSSGIAG